MATNSDGNYCAKTTEQFRDFLFEQSPIAALVMQEMKRGKSCAHAIEFVCGDGAFKKFASEIYHSIRSKN